MACLMRVLAKPELDNSVILNEFIMIMENFGVMDSPEDEENDDYVPDTTEQSICQSTEDLAEKIEKEEKSGEDKVAKSKTTKSKDGPKEKDEKKKAKKHDLSRIDAKGIKILRKLARFLLK